MPDEAPKANRSQEKRINPKKVNSMERKAHQTQEVKRTKQDTKSAKGTTSRRSLLRAGLAVGGAGAVATIGAGLLNAKVLTPHLALAQEQSGAPTPTPTAPSTPPPSPTEGDIAILRFLAALEIIESDLWQQYNELGGIQDQEVPGGSGNGPYTAALKNLDGDMDQYIHDNTDDEFSHFQFLNGFLDSIGAEPVNLDQFRTLPSSKATGAQQIGRLTNLTELTVDTSWWTRYRSDSKNPDPPFNDTFPQAVPTLFNNGQGQFPAIPRNDDDTKDPKHIQAIANTAAFHFAFIEQGGTSLYPSLAQRVTDRTALRILLSIGPTETMHFQTWQDKAGHAVLPAPDGLAPLTDPTNGLTFPDLSQAGEEFQPNLIMPEPTIFLDRKFPICSIIRPTETQGAAKGAVAALTADGLFNGQSPAFFVLLAELANAADGAVFMQ